MNSPRFPPAGLLIRYRGSRVAIDGGPGAAPAERVHAWLLTDERAELRREIAHLAARHDIEPAVQAFAWQDLCVEPLPVAHTNHPAYGYLLRAPHATAAWAPEFWTFPTWAAGVDILFAEAASWNRPIRFRGGVGGHQPVLQVARDAQQHGVRRVVYVHIGRPTLPAIDRGEQPPFGEWGRVGATYVLPD